MTEPMLTTESLGTLQSALGDAGVDGWLLFDFHGLNPIATGLLGFEGLLSRRIFAWVPREGIPVAVTHAIEQGPWKYWPPAWERRVYSRWRELETELAVLVRGKRVAMEYSPGDAVPYLDRVPAGVLEMVRAAGAQVVSSAPLVTGFYARLTRSNIDSHLRAARHVSRIAQANLAEAGRRARAGTAMTEHEIQARIMEEFRSLNLEFDHGPIVAAGENAANPHYEPSALAPRLARSGELLLIDLWAREKGGVYADQTWMCALGEPSKRALEVWNAVRDARDAAIGFLRQRLQEGAAIRGAEVDDQARGVIEARGFGRYFPHRTGHSIDPRDLHGSGPHLDNLETREERELVSGVAFSIEPGVYIAGEIGVRSEVNAIIDGATLVVTPEDYQRELPTL
jgi:Xaa-Pro aminopeptidase